LRHCCEVTENFLDLDLASDSGHENGATEVPDGVASVILRVGKERLSDWSLGSAIDAFNDLFQVGRCKAVLACGVSSHHNGSERWSDLELETCFGFERANRACERGCVFLKGVISL